MQRRFLIKCQQACEDTKEAKFGNMPVTCQEDLFVTNEEEEKISYVQFIEGRSWHFFGEGKVVTLILYVDDLIMTGSHSENLEGEGAFLEGVRDDGPWPFTSFF